MSLLIRAVGILLAAGQTVLLARLLGPENLGIYAAVIALTAILAVPASSGLGEFLTREVAGARARMDLKLARGLVKSANVLLILYSLMSIVALFVLVAFDLYPSNTPATVALSCGIIVLLGTGRLRAGAMRGMGSALLSQLPETILRPGIFLLAVLALLYSSGGIDVTSALSAFVIGATGASVFGYICLYLQLDGLKGATKVQVGASARGSMGLTLLGGLGTLQTNLDIALLSLLGFFVEAGQLRVALLGIMALLFVYNALSAVAVRDLAASIALRELGTTMKVSDRLTSGATVSAMVVTVAFVLFGEGAIALIFGPEYEDANTAMVILAVGHLISIACGPALEIVRLLQSQVSAVYINLFSLLATIAISLSLLHWDALLAVAIGSASGIVIRRVVLAFYVSKSVGFDITCYGALVRTVRKRRTAGVTS